MDPSLLLVLSNLLHLQNHLDNPSTTSLLSSSSPSSTSSSAAPLLFFALASALSYASSSLLRHPRPSSPPSHSHHHPLLRSPPRDDSLFRRSFGLSFPVFSTLLDHLHPHLSRLSLPVPSDLALSISLSRLHLGLSPLSLSRHHHLHPYLISKITNSVTRLLSTNLYPDYVKIPAGHRLLHTVHSFKDLSGGLPNICGAIDGSPIKIKLPSSTTATSAAAFRRHGGHPAVLLQAVADHRAIFWDVCIRAPGSSDDASHLRESALYGRLTAGEILQDAVTTVRGHHVRPYLVGDWCYPLMSFLLTPFTPNGTGTPARNRFDEALMRAREVSVVRAIGLLKARWGILRKGLNVGLDHAPQTVAACCVLHNMCQVAGEPEPEGGPWREPEESGTPARALESEKSFCFFGERLRQALADDLQEKQQRVR
ncbi:hypothetical protein QJS04_geneDACA019610 [Acorus gramineus]|uniref:DDE Tnp4 domain-containing protein n=1 Tax=Acorus gramineus TaxID=55184 RepID=A0AAV9BLM6_ACOGR|nr:hypothetical protein QJS04_geneDACA019610 [Acorus gramineus]